MNCEDCDRANVVKAYCYFKNRQAEFKGLTKSSFSVDSFAVYAVEMELEWRYSVSCKKMSRHQTKEYWDLIVPELERYLHKSQKGQNLTPIRYNKRTTLP